MNNLNWELVFKLKEFKAYYNSWDLNELSMGCKEFRKLLHSAVFKSFNFIAYVEANGYKSLKTDVNEEEDSNENDNNAANNNGEDDDYVDFEMCSLPIDPEYIADISNIINPYLPLTQEYIESKNQFNSDLKNYHSRPKQVVLYHSKDYYYLLRDIPDVFSRLSTLTIAYSHLTVESLQHLLDSLSHLENFELTRCYLFQYPLEQNQIPINWPYSLVKFNFSDNFASFVEDKLSPIRLYNGEITNASNSYLKLFPKHLPKLTDLVCEVFGQDPEIECLEEFLKLNTQIKSLKIGGGSLNKKIFYIIKSYENLTHLELDYISYNLRGSSLNEFPILSRISHLSILLRNYLENLDLFILKFPNLSSCLIEAIYGDFDQFYDLCIKLPNIKSLKLKQHSSWGHPIEIILPKIDNLTGIEFSLHSFSEYEKFKMNADSCKNLNSVKFTEYGDQSSSNNSNLTPELTGSWEVVHFHRSFSYYRNY
ncbi:hypothetical protein CONCODRAFT_86804 [Conidiobolus coronatus NRRL 28638]|uniref:F-box domain-containing protein n=1 Tax=Conidiobolus coronatus (strain ATCC 28846 / CBS 209.66 / NRRL 28638) TaxID=796925 RepID=A0A137NYM6_CONC2|nr:hypothetical protein CONCODRAFT_86804 [Conidiobolus coronatus NRRL 28638]|eukprot:KXN67709.1 hypothetical protein CONCODRAFT_86804 [Conidiobolus coronatus NRRL 28638]